jgi:hypothetical protein
LIGFISTCVAGDSSREEDRYKPPLFDGTNYGDCSFRMEIFLDEKEILTHMSRPLAELQEEFRLTGNENQEMRSAKQKKLDKLSTDDKKCKKNGFLLSHVFGALLISIINIYFYCALVNSA